MSAFVFLEQRNWAGSIERRSLGEKIGADMKLVDKMRLSFSV